MAAIQFDDRLFQRGQTWRECVEGWENRRELFLRMVQQQEPMKNMRTQLGRLPYGSRVVVYYNMWTFVSLKTLPAVGVTFAHAPHIQVRYFSADLFYPLFYQSLGRVAPRLILLDESGKPRRQWGPYPESLKSSLARKSGADAAEIDRYVFNLNDRRFSRTLDRSISKKLVPGS